MTVSLKLDNNHTMIFSDNHFKPYRKKPTISIYDAELNVEQKIASFNSDECFKWFIGLLNVKEGD